MTLDEIERAIALAKSRSLAELECAIGHGGRLKVIVNRPHKPVAPAAEVARPAKAKNAIRTRYFGVFADAVPPIRIGDRVTEHQIVGFLELGEIRFAIQAEKAGKVAAKPVKTGDLVGYGETVFEFE
jgi:biotin carboxyl carrier protein